MWRDDAATTILIIPVIYFSKIVWLAFSHSTGNLPLLWGIMGNKVRRVQFCEQRKGCR